MGVVVPSRRGISPADRKRAARRQARGRETSQRIVTRRNRQRIFEEIVITDGPSAKDIAEITGLGQSTVSGVLEQLRNSRLILVGQPEPGGGGERGRQPRPIRVNNQEHYVAGIEVEAERVHGLITDLDGQPVMLPEQIDFPGFGKNSPADPDTVVDGVRELVEKLTAQLLKLRDDAHEQRPLLGMGVEIGGQVDSESGVVRFSPNLRWGRDWTEPIMLGQRLRDATRLYTVLDNDVNALAIAQRWFGVGRELESFAVVYVSKTGIGGAQFAQRDIVRGATGGAWELGHQIVAPNGPRCRCMGRGCAEAVATVAVIAEALGDTPEGALQRADDGDRKARRAFADAGRALGRAVANARVVTDPGRIIFTSDQIRPSRLDDRRLVLVNDDYHAAMCEIVQDHPMSADAVGSFEFVADEERWNGPRGAATLVIRDVIAGVVQV